MSFFTSLFQDEYGTIEYLRACLHGDGGPQLGEVTCGRSLHLSCKRDQTKNERLHGQAGYPLAT